MTDRSSHQKKSLKILKVVIKRRKQKRERQHNGQNDNYLQNTTQKTKDQAIRTPLETVTSVL